jgi:hypothetical protein
MADIFLSYAREDRAAAERIAQALAGRGYNVWWDRDIPAGPSYTQVIEQALVSAKCVLVLWSAVSVASSWVQDEAREGQERGVLVAARLENVKPPLGFRGQQLTTSSGAFCAASKPTCRCLHSRRGSRSRHPLRLTPGAAQFSRKPTSRSGRSCRATPSLRTRVQNRRTDPTRVTCESRWLASRMKVMARATSLIPQLTALKVRQIHPLFKTAREQ